VSLTHLIAQYGLAAMFVGAALEGETVVFTGGLLVHQQLLPFWGTVLSAAIGSACWDQLLFFAGRHWREHPRVQRLIARPGVSHAMAAFHRRPKLYTFGFRFLYGMRTISPLAIGSSAMPARQFVLLNLVAALVWATALTTIGYFLGHALAPLLGRLHNLEHLLVRIGIAAVIAVAIGWLVHRWAKRA